MKFPKKQTVVGILSLATLMVFALCTSTYAASYLTRVSNLLSTSAPGALVNQTIMFRLTQAIPANGAIEVYFNEGGFTIPANLDHTDVDVSFGPTETGPFTERNLNQVQTAATDDVTVTSGSAGKIRFDLNTSVGISAGSVVRIEIGTNATAQTNGDQRMTLATATSSYPVTISTFNTADVELDYGRTMIAIVEQVQAGPVDTTDQDPPIILTAEPTGLLQVGTRAVELYVVTNELSACRWATSSMGYAIMPYALTPTTTIAGLGFSHFGLFSGLEDDTDYDVFIRCIDFRSNEINPDYLLEFTVGITPGSASSTATSTGTGTGTGTSTATSTATTTGSGTGTGTGTGSGTGASGSGSGSSPDGGDDDGPGGSGSGSGSGTNLPQADVQIEGWAYPGATVSFLRDGVVMSTDGTGGAGEFSYLIQGLDRGMYTFAVFAQDSSGTRGATYSTTISLRASTLTTLANIMLPPTLTVVENSVDPGTPLVLTGYSVPNALITTWLRPKLAQVTTGDIVATTTALSNGSWSVTLQTTGLSQGTYEIVAQGKMPSGLVESDKSIRKTIGIGVEVADDSCLGRGDLNCDESINLVDFSILLFNWNTASAAADINGDGIVSLPDFSIMLFNWTG